jgi:caffeoyl-CoA O-methyltransferase
VSDPVQPQAARYALAHTTPLQGAVADAAEWTSAHTDSPDMMSGVPEARLLEALIVVGGARRVLEIGTFTGVGTLMMAAALAPGGRVITLEADEDNAAAARRHFAASPLADRIELRAGDARAAVPELDGEFDLVYIDAWKNDYPAYYEAVLPKLAPRGVIVADNLFRGGGVFDPSDDSASTAGVRAFAQRVSDDERVDNVLLTVGDGVMLVWRRPAP